MRRTKTYLFVFIALLFLSVNSFADGWKQIANEDNITVFSKDAKNAIIPFKATGIIHSSLRDVLEALKDTDSKNLWSPKLKSVKLHKILNQKEYLFSEFYKTPWPATDREFLLKGKIQKISNTMYEVSAHSIDNGKLANDDHIQAQVEYINIILEEVSPNQTRIQFEFLGDMKGWMPVWLTNLIQKKWPLRFIQGLRRHLKTSKNLDQKVATSNP